MFFSKFQNPVQYQNANPQSQPQPPGPPQYFVQPLNQNGNQIRNSPQQTQVCLIIY
jgi:hypothetical protein